MASHRGNNDNECCTTDDTIILLWGNSFLAKLSAKRLAEIGIVATVTVDEMVAYSHPCDRDISMSYTADVTVGPLGRFLLNERAEVTGETMTMNAAQLRIQLSCFGEPNCRHKKTAG